MESDFGSEMPCLPPCIFGSVLQDNPEVEKRDPQELVGKYGNAVRAHSEPWPKRTGFRPRGGLLSASAKAAVLAGALSLLLSLRASGIS